MTIRRRNQDEISAALFGPPGAPGGLYDPPPVGNDERVVGNYMLLDFKGGATVLLPHRLDQRLRAWERQGRTGVGHQPGLDAGDHSIPCRSQVVRGEEDQGTEDARAERDEGGG